MNLDNSSNIPSTPARPPAYQPSVFLMAIARGAPTTGNATASSRNRLATACRPTASRSTPPARPKCAAARNRYAVFCRRRPCGLCGSCSNSGHLRVPLRLDAGAAETHSASRRSFLRTCEHRHVLIPAPIRATDHMGAVSRLAVIGQILARHRYAVTANVTPHPMNEPCRPLVGALERYVRASKLQRSESAAQRE